MADNLYNFSCRVISVVDGDTIDVDIDLGFNVHLKQRVRLYGINTPETRTRNLEEKKRGLAAKARLVELLAECGNEVLLESREWGKYGRCLGIIRPKEPNLFSKTPSYLSINEILVDEGHAVEYHGGKRE